MKVFKGILGLLLLPTGIYSGYLALGVTIGLFIKDDVNIGVGIAYIIFALAVMLAIIYLFYKWTLKPVIAHFKSGKVVANG